MTFTLTLPQLLLLITAGVGVAHLAGQAFDYVTDRFIFISGSGLPRPVRTWYGTGRTVHHPILGACQVLDVDLWADWEYSWLLIAATDDDTDPPRWVPLTEVSETAGELKAGEDR